MQSNLFLLGQAQLQTSVCQTKNLDNNNKAFTFNLDLLEGRKMLIMSLKQRKKNLAQGCN